MVTAEESGGMNVTHAHRGPLVKEGQDKADKIEDPGMKTEVRDGAQGVRVARGTRRGMIVVGLVTSATADPTQLPSLAWKDGSSS